MLVTRKNFDRCLSWFTDCDRLIYDTETNGLKPWGAHRVVGVSLTEPRLRRVCYFPIRHAQGENLRWSHYRRLLWLLSQRSVVYTGWNIKFDLEFLMADGMLFPRHIEDVMLGCHHLNENDKPFELKRWAVKYADADAGLSEQDLAAKVKKLMREQGIKTPKGAGTGAWKGCMYLLPPADVEPYACDDVRSTEKLRRLVVSDCGLPLWASDRYPRTPMQLWRDSNAYLRAIAKMEIRGMQLDVRRMHRLIREAKRNERKAYKVLVAKAGHEINVNSPKQMHAFLKVTSATKDILEELGTPEAEAVLSYRAWNKARTTYYERWLHWMDQDHVLHPNLNLHRVVTGRQSASDPNTHGVPRYRSEYKVKEAVVARPGYVLISADYNQAELRVGVSVAQEHNMAALFRSKPKPGKKHVDIHQLVADALQIERDEAKTINFMILYGGGEEKLSRKLKILVLKARKYLFKYHREYWHFKHASNFWANRARYQKYIRLWSGRIRHFNHPLANPKDAFNSLVQGGVAEMLRIAITTLARKLPKYDCHMLLQIHDQIIFECPVNLVDQVTPIIRHVMEDFPHWMIPPVADFKVGRRWATLKDYQFPEERKKAA